VARALGETGLETLEVACGLTLQTGVIAAAIALNEMRRLSEATRPKTLSAIALTAPALRIEPKADCGRHAQLKALRLHGIPSAPTGHKGRKWRLPGKNGRLSLTHDRNR
jgi:hypothetical protein